MKKMLFLFNPRSGKEQIKSHLLRILDIFSKAGYDIHVHVTQCHEKVLLAKNYKEAAQALQDAGYATDPTYADKIIHVIEEYNLNKYDR